MAYRSASLCREKRDQKSTFDLHKSVHETEYENVKRPIDARTKEPIEPAHKFEVTLEPDSFTEEKYALFENYQRVVHREPPGQISRPSFKQFLCSGIGQTKLFENGKEKEIGSYHQCYRLDGKLVAMGVLDLLPNCVSSVYLMYHEDVNDWKFGKISALREISLALEGDYRWYYMGFYIHSCVKMRYKGAFRPSYLLDPVSHTWDLLDSDMIQRLSARRFVSMTLERELNIPADPLELANLLQTLSPDSPLHGPIENGNVKYSQGLEYVQGTETDDSESDGEEKTVFGEGMPGAMPLEELESEVDLGKWGLTLNNRLFNLEDLLSWEESDASDPYTVKGVAAGLAACIGPELVRETILDFGGMMPAE